MSPFEEHVEDLQRHIRRVQDNAGMLAAKLADAGQTAFAKALLANVQKHDASKWHGIEWEVMHVGPNVDKKLLAKAVQQHQSTNKHHPEYWGGLDAMPSIFIAEMVCDWLARSQEFGSDLRAWVATDAVKRYPADPEQWAVVHAYVDQLLPAKFVKDLNTEG